MGSEASVDHDGQDVPGDGTPSSDQVLPGDDRSRHFAFEHKVFTVDGGFFAPISTTGEAAFHIPLGDLKGAVPLETLRFEFNLGPDSLDGRLLDIVEKSLRYVKEIRPGDSIPHELLDGSASWKVEEKHREIAKNRLTVQLVSWLTGGEAVIVDLTQLEQIAGDPTTRQKVNEAFTRAAEKLGLGKDRREEVVNMVDTLARELSFIEALRDRFGYVKQIQRNFDVLSNLYRRDQGIRNEIFRMQALIKTPVMNFEGMFGQTDAQTGEILAVLRNIQAQIKFIRDVRDDLHFRLMLWDDLIARWTATPIEKSPEMEALLKETYRFLARHFSSQVEWPLAGRR
ncbi:hypothetical protein [Arenibaculum pallidiluteum]|uniref:hypothetical protein n=1 Tax=Arenibaculum pallidiluteum TaxID=2812559 RepID=UPI001A96E0DA|nr:hypothetical protein [Arenibaculum pallidiluteum]